MPVAAADCVETTWLMPSALALALAKLLSLEAEAPTLTERLPVEVTVPVATPEP